MDPDLPLSRREARERRRLEEALDVTESEAENEARELDALNEDDVDTVRAASDQTDEARRTRTPRRRRWVLLGAVAALIVLVVGGGLAALRLYDQAMTVRGHLEASINEVQAVKNAVLSGDLNSAEEASARLTKSTERAVAGTHGRLWSAAESVPWIGDDLTAVRQVAEITDALANDVVAPASSVSLESFRPTDGRIDLEAVEALAPLLDQVQVGVDEASEALGRIDRNGLIPQVDDGVGRLDAALTEAAPMIGPIRDVVSVLPNALGANGPRNYLLMFQGTSESRSLGGNAAVFIVMRAEEGSLTIVDQIQSSDFGHSLPAPVIDLDPEAEAIFGDKIGRYTADFTMVPDLPEAVRILRAWWDAKGFTPFDAVLSVDPIALSYILNATGPVSLPTGEVLTSENAPSLLLNGVYFRYEDPLAQNAFFGAASSSIFRALTGGQFAPSPFMDALVRAASEGRLLYWSEDPTESALIAGARIQGVMPSSNAQQTVLGIYVNDNTGSKMSYYLDMSAVACRSETSVNARVTLTSQVTPADAARLPSYVSGTNFAPGDISTYLALYGPVGSRFASVTVDGSPAQVLSAGNHLSRPVVKIEIFNHPESTHTVSVTFDDVDPMTGELSVWHTPMSRESRVEIAGDCT